MQKRSSKQGPKDLNEIAFRVAGEAAGDMEPEQPREKNPAAVQLGRMGGLVGGRARASKLSPDKRSEIAKRAAQARWSNQKNDR